MNTVDNLEFIKRVESSDACNRDEVIVKFVDGFVDEVDIENNEFYVGGSAVSFDECDESDFSFYTYEELDADLDDIFEYVKYIKKVQRSFENPDAKKLTVLWIDGGSFIQEYNIEEYISLSELSDKREQMEIWELKLIK